MEADDMPGQCYGVCSGLIPLTLFRLDIRGSRYLLSQIDVLSGNAII